MNRSIVMLERHPIQLNDYHTIVIHRDTNYYHRSPNRITFQVVDSAGTEVTEIIKLMVVMYLTFEE